MGIFSGIGEAYGSKGGLYLTPGSYVVQIGKCKEEKSHDGRDKFFIAELLVISSEGEGVLAPSTEPSFVMKLSGKYPELALGNVADFMRAAIASLSDARGIARAPELDQIPLDEPTADAVTESNILEGTFVTAKAWIHITREKKEFTRVKWGVPTGQAAAPAA